MPLRRPRRRRSFTLERQPDALPKAGLFPEPLRVARLEALEPERLEDEVWRTTFLVEVRDAQDGRCPQIAVEATVTGPERTATAQGVTDMFGRVRFRMRGTPGTYAIEIRDVAAGGLRWEPTEGPRTATTHVIG